MSKKSTHTWQVLKGFPPGKRFELFFNHRQTLHSSFLRRLSIIGGGIFFVIAGFIFLPTPVPGILLLFFGGSLLAQESLIAARILDWSEMRMRHFIMTSSRFWTKTHISLKVLIIMKCLILISDQSRILAAINDS